MHRRLSFVALVASLLLPVALASPASAHHGDLPRIHWESGHRQAITVYNRAGSPFVAQSVADWNAAAGGLVSYDPNIVTGGDPNDCSAPPNYSIALCRVNGGNPYALYAGMDHLGWCVVGLAWDDLPTVEHEMGHCLGLGHHGDGQTGPFGGWDGGIMGAEGRITQVDVDALRTLYSHSDTPAPAATPQPIPPSPSPQSFPAPAAATPPTATNFGYSCATPTNVGATSATIGGVTSDPGVGAVTISVSNSSGVVGQTTVGYPFQTQANGLSPSTAYTFAVRFNPVGATASGPGCSFTTSAGATSAGATSAGAPSPAATPPSSSIPPPSTPPPSTPAPAAPQPAAAPTYNCLILTLFCH